MFKIMISLILVSFAFVNTVIAGEQKMKARIDITSTVKLKIVKNCSHAGWLRKNKEKYDRFLVSHSSTLNADEWIDFSLEFIALADGEISIGLLGMNIIDKISKKRIAKWCYFDKVIIEGANLKNGDFEEINAKGILKAWKPTRRPLEDENMAASGKHFITVWHNKRCYQKIKVKKGQLIKITAKVKDIG